MKPSRVAEDAALTPAAVGYEVAERVSGCSYKTLLRASQRGEPVGLFRVNRKVLFDLDQLKRWLASKAATAA